MSHPNAPDVITRGIVIRLPWILHILNEEKTWELRGKPTAVRERIALIQGGSGLIVGTARVVDSIGPLDRASRVRAASAGHILPVEIDEDIYAEVHAWVLADIEPLETPVPYKHPSGAVIWVTLPTEAQAALAAATGTPVATTVPSRIRSRPARNGRAAPRARAR